MNKCTRYSNTISKTMRPALLLLLTWLMSTGLEAQIVVDMTKLDPDHPRLSFTPGNLPTVKNLITTEPRAIDGFASMKERGNKIIAGTDRPNDNFDGPVSFPFTDGQGNNPNFYARYLMSRMQTMAGLYLLDDNATDRARWFNQAKADLLAIAAFPYWAAGGVAGDTDDDWQFLETSALTIAAATGYDWLYNSQSGIGGLSATDQATVRAAIINKGLAKGQSAYNATPQAEWVKWINNWGLICNSGMGLGAAAVGNDGDATQDAMTADVLPDALNNLQYVMDRIYVDGGGEEGLNYWSYGLQYNVLLLDGVRTAFNNTEGEFGLAGTPGFEDTGYYPIHMLGESKGASGYTRSFNFSDQGDNGATGTEQLLWLSRRFVSPSATGAARAKAIYAQWGMGTSSNLSTPFQLLWYRADLFSPAVSMPPVTSYFSQPGTVTLRSSWTDANAFYVGIRGGSNRSSHGHLEMGTFVLDALGERWVSELGAEDYQLPGAWDGDQQSGRRWTYYRWSTEGQNTLAITGNTTAQQAMSFANQSLSGVATRLSQSAIPAQGATPNKSFVVYDLTSGYESFTGEARNLAKVHRGIALLNNNQVLLQDEITNTSGAPNAEVIWQMHTSASITIDPNNAKIVTLTQNGKSMRVEILASPSTARFEVGDASPSPCGAPDTQENCNTGISKLLIRLGQRVSTTTVHLAVRFAAPTNTSKPTNLTALANWPSWTPAFAGRVSQEAAASNEAETASQEAVRIYPVPTTGSELNVEFTAKQAGQASVALHSLSGQPLLERQSAVQAGVNRMRMNVSHLQSGMYLVVIRKDGQLIRRKVTLTR